MKICDIVQAFTARSGGIRTYIRAKQRYLAARGVDHVLIMPGGRDRTYEQDGARVHEVASPFVPGYRPYRFNFRVGRVAAILERERPDVIELASPYVMPWVAFRHRRRHPGCRVVGYYHADVPCAYVAGPVASVLGDGAGRAAERLAGRYMRAMHSRCDLTVTAAPTFRRRLEQSGVPRVVEVPLGVDLDLFHPRRRRRDLWVDIFPGQDPAEPVLMYCGRLDREKQVEVLVEAHRRLRSSRAVRLFMVGEGPLRPLLEDAAAGEPLLEVRPYIGDREELAALLASADLYVTAGPYETFGLSVMEAQASGLPVVGVAAGALPDRVAPECGILVPVGDARAMAEASARLLADDPRRLGRTVRARLELDGDWSVVFSRMLALYRHGAPSVGAGVTVAEDLVDQGAW